MKESETATHGVCCLERGTILLVTMSLTAIVNLITAGWKQVKMATEQTGSTVQEMTSSRSRGGPFLTETPLPALRVDGNARLPSRSQAGSHPIGFKV